MVRVIGLGLGSVLLAVGLLGAHPAEAKRDRARQGKQRYSQRPPYGRAYGYRTNRADLDRDGIPNYRDRDDDGDRIPDTRDRWPYRFNRSRVGGFRSMYRDLDRDGIRDDRDRDIDGDRVPNNRDRYDWNRLRR